MAAPRSNASWERVLAAIEADAARAAALLTADDAHATAGISYDDPGADPPPPVDVPATWRLPDQPPGRESAGPESARRSFAADFAAEALPDPVDLPPLTPEVRARLTELQTRIATLQDELSAAMSEAEALVMRAPARAAAARAQQPARPELVDRRL